MDDTSRVVNTCLAVAKRGFQDGKAGKTPASVTYFAEMAVKALPGMGDLDLLCEFDKALQDSYSIAYEGGLNHGEAT